MHLRSLEKISRKYKIKENKVSNHIEQFSTITVVQDRLIQDGCSVRRCGILIELGYQVIIIEVDKNEHIDCDCSWENK